MRILPRIAAALLASALLTALPAMAQTPAGGDTSASRSGLRAIPKDRRAEAMDMLRDYKDGMQAMNAELVDKMARMDAEFGHKSLNESRIRALAGEILSLRATLYKQSVDFRIAFYKEFGVLPF